MSAARHRRVFQPPRWPDPVAAAAACIFTAAGAAAVATMLSPGGYPHEDRLAAALLLGAAVSLLLLAALYRLLARRLPLGKSPTLYTAMACALVLLLAAAGARILVSRTDGPQATTAAPAERAFRTWTLQAVPLLVRYKDALAADAAQTIGRTGGTRRASAPPAGVERARRSLLALERPLQRLARTAPADLRAFMPLLGRAVRLAVEAQSRYQWALAVRGARSRALHRQANQLLIRSQQAMAAFSVGVNGVGARLANGESATP